MSKARGPYRVDPLGHKKSQQALDKKAENARELGLDYKPAQQEPSDLDVWKARALQAEAVIAKFMAEQPAQPHQEPVDKRCSPCPEFWDWLPRAYNFEGLGNFTKYNMEVAFLAGMQSTHLPAQPQQEPVAWMRHDGKRVTTAADRENYPDYETRYSIPLYTSPPAQRLWVGLTDEEKVQLWNHDTDAPLTYADAIEAALRSKNENTE